MARESKNRNGNWWPKLLVANTFIINILDASEIGLNKKVFAQQIIEKAQRLENPFIDGRMDQCDWSKQIKLSLVFIDHVIHLTEMHVFLFIVEQLIDGNKIQYDFWHANFKKL